MDHGPCRGTIWGQSPQSHSTTYSLYASSPAPNVFQEFQEPRQHTLSGGADTRLSELSLFLHATSILASQSARVPDIPADCMQLYQITGPDSSTVLGASQMISRRIRTFGVFTARIETYDIDAEIDGLWRQELYPITLISSING